MADIQPFRGLRYSLVEDRDLGELLCPPYDVISSEQQTALQQTSPYNAIRLELGIDIPTDSANVNRYTRSADLLEEWLSQDILLTEEDSAIYLIQEEFPYKGSNLTRRSIVTRVRLEEFSKGIVLPHEETSQGPKKDRMELLMATKANLSPIMGIYRDNSGKVGTVINRVAETQPLVTGRYGDIAVRLWVVTHKDTLDIITQSLKSAPIYLADGHHRYETALSYRNIQQSSVDMDWEAGYNFVMMSLIEIKDPGLVVLPYHRVIKGLSIAQQEQILHLIHENFSVEHISTEAWLGGDLGSYLENQVEQRLGDKVVIGLLRNGGQDASVLTFRETAGNSASPLERCATWVLDTQIIGPVLGTQQEAVENGILTYTHDALEVAELVNNGDYQIGFLLPPLALNVFEEVVLSGDRLPIKSTYFSPKLPTGLVINRLI